MNGYLWAACGAAGIVLVGTLAVVLWQDARVQQAWNDWYERPKR